MEKIKEWFIQTMEVIWTKIDGFFNGIPCEKVPLKDKGCHIIAGYIITGIAMFFVPTIFALAIGVFAGWLKEEIDRRRKGKWDFFDFFATVGGSVLAVFTFGFILIFI